MSLQWHLAATFLYVEIGLVLILILPIISPKRWSRIFKSRMLAVVSSQTQIYFLMLCFTLVLLFLDALREQLKLGNEEKNSGQAHQLDHEMQINMRLFRAQRNTYISGLALFLTFVIKRLIVLITELACLQAEKEAALKQAASASAAARNLMSQAAETDQNTCNANEDHDKETNALKEEIKSLKETLEKEKKDKDAVKSQAEATNKEYDRLTSEFSKLQRQLETAGAGDKKAD